MSTETMIANMMRLQAAFIKSSGYGIEASLIDGKQGEYAYVCTRKIEADQQANGVNCPKNKYKPPLKLPKENEKLSNFAAENNLPGSRPGENWLDYRSRLQLKIKELNTNN